MARQWVQDVETAIMQQQEDMSTAENAGATTRKPENTFKEMLNAIRDSLSDLASSNDEQDGEDEAADEEDTELSKLSDDASGWVMGIISKTVQHCMESFQQKQLRLDELMQLGWGDAANYFSERNMKYGTAELKVPAVVKPQIDMTAAIPSPTTFGELMQTLDIVPGQTQMPAVTSQPGSSQMWLGSEKPQSYKFIPVFLPDAAPDSTPIEDAKPVEPERFYPCI